MSPITNFSPNKETEVALRVAEIVLKQKGGHFTVVPAGVNFGSERVIVASLIHGDDQSTLICNEEIAKKLKETGKIGETGLIFQNPQPKK